MELIETGVRIRDCSIDFIPVYVKQETDEHRTGFNDVEILAAAQRLCIVEIKEPRRHGVNNKVERLETNNSSCLSTLELELSTTHHDENRDGNNVGMDPMYLGALDSEGVNVEIQSPANQASEVFIDCNEYVQMARYDISMVNIPSEFLGLNLMIKKDAGVCQEAVYTTEWMHNINKETNLHLRFSRKKKQKAELCVDLEGTLITTKRQRILIAKSNENVGREAKEGCKSTKPRTRLRSATFQDCRDRLRRKAECMREKRRKLYERESEDQRQQRLAQEAAKRREMRMYYETPEQKRKRLDAEAARKREYRMYSETPEDRRKRLDREAERRRTKRLSLYASETPEQRRERLNKESAKRREARLNQYAKETEEQRRERLRRDALRAREMRFTRSAIETEEERRQRLVKDALRKREVRMHGGRSVSNNFTELQTVRNFEELNNVQIKDNPDNQLGGHYLSNWMMWFQNTLAQPIHVGEQNVESQSQTNR